MLSLCRYHAGEMSQRYREVHSYAHGRGLVYSFPACNRCPHTLRGQVDMHGEQSNMKTRMLLGLTCAVLLLALLTSAPANAQVLYGSIVGTVEDPTGAVVPGATITLTNPSTGAIREIKADDQGRYTVPNLQAGSYELKVASQGFRTRMPYCDASWAGRGMRRFWMQRMATFKRRFRTNSNGS